MDNRELQRLLDYAAERGVIIPIDLTLELLRKLNPITADDLPLYTLNKPGIVPAPKKKNLLLGSDGWEAKQQPSFTYSRIPGGYVKISGDNMTGELTFLSTGIGRADYVKSTTAQIGGITNYVDIAAGGELTLKGTATRWDDLRIEPTARGTGANNPAFEQYADDTALGDTGTSRGIFLYSFDDAVEGSEKEVFFTMQMPHAWAGTGISMHVHWIGAVSDTTAAPRWGLEYAWKDIGQTFGGTLTVYTDGKNFAGDGYDANVTAGKHYISEFDTLEPGATADGVSSVLIGRLFRNSSATEDTYNAGGAKCGLLYIDAHYEIDAFGSSSEYVK